MYKENKTSAAGRIKFKHKGDNMGRAIDMENDIDKLKVKVEKLENQVRGMISKIDEISEKSSKTKHIDLVEDVGAEIEDNKKEKDGKKKTDNEGDAKSSKQPDSKSGKSNKKSI